MYNVHLPRPGAGIRLVFLPCARHREPVHMSDVWGVRSSGCALRMRRACHHRWYYCTATKRGLFVGAPVPYTPTMADGCGVLPVRKQCVIRNSIDNSADSSALRMTLMASDLEDPGTELRH